MPRTATYKVTLTFSDNITEKELTSYVTKQICDALFHQVDSGMGLAPDDTEAVTKLIEVTREGFKHTFTQNF